MNPQNITHRARIEACLSGEKPDRTPVALWRHFPIDDQSAASLAAATSAFQHLYDFDLIKVTPSSSFCLRDWGIQDEWTGNSEGTRDYTNRVVVHPEDWRKLSILNPNRGVLAEQLECLKLLLTEFSPGVPIIQTIFSPMSQAKNLIGKDNLVVHLRQYPDAVHEGLQRISESTSAFLEECKQIGIDGVFYAVQQAQFGVLTSAEFDSFCKPYDLQLLQQLNPLWLNMLHIHGENIMFDQISEYPVQILNWHDRLTSPSLSEAQMKYSGIVCGGLEQWAAMALGRTERVRAEAREAIQATQGKKFILGTGCVLPIIAPHGNILAARQIVEEIS